MVPDWADFYRAISGREPRPLLPRALEAWGDATGWDGHGSRGG